jgi:hypothetical protein
MSEQGIRDRHMEATIERIGAAFDEIALFRSPVVRAVRRLRHRPLALERDADGGWRLPLGRHAG